MSDVIVKSVKPADIVQPSDLAVRINAEHEKVKDALQRGAMHAIEAGRLLMQAKATVQHGEWLDWIGTNCQFAHRTAETYMRLAEGAHLLEANSQRAANMTYREAVRLIAELKGPEEARMSLSTRTRKRRDPIGDAIKNDPLSILERAWGAAGNDDQEVFKKKIGA